MKVFLDTNVLVDYLNKREPFFEDASSASASRDRLKAYCLPFL